MLGLPGPAPPVPRSLAPRRSSGKHTPAWMSNLSLRTPLPNMFVALQFTTPDGPLAPTEIHRVDT
eukprot:2810953-Lingulodinium_polyedra.AAC.1